MISLWTNALTLFCLGNRNCLNHQLPSPLPTPKQKKLKTKNKICKKNTLKILTNRLAHVEIVWSARDHSFHFRCLPIEKWIAQTRPYLVSNVTITCRFILASFFYYRKQNKKYHFEVKTIHKLISLCLLKSLNVKPLYSLRVKPNCQCCPNHP